MIDDQTPFIDAIRAAPEDDTPRLIFADWLDEHGQAAKADFIRTQCKTATVNLGDSNWEQLSKHERHLLETHANEWVMPLTRICKEWEHQDFAYTEKWEFQRGFVRDIAVRGSTFLKHSRQIFEAAPLLEGVALYPFDGDPDELATCAALRDVRDLNIYQNFGDDALRSLVAAPVLGFLRSLLLHANGITGSGMQHLVASDLMAKLTILDLWANKMDPDAIDMLVNGTHARRLKWLGLGWTGMGLEGLQAIASSSQMPNLQGLDINAGTYVEEATAYPANPVSAEGCRMLAEAKHLEGLRDLRMEDHQIGDAGIELLASSKYLRGLARLHLRYNQITSIGASVLAGASSQWNPVTLDLSQNPIGAKGAISLAKSPRLARLQSIDLDGCNIRDEGIEAIAASPHLRELRAMWIADNGISDRGLKMLAKSSNLPNLSTLVLYRNHITEDGLNALADPQNIPSLKRVAVSNDSNSFRSALAKKLRSRYGSTFHEQSEYARWKTLSHPSRMVTRPSMGGIGICLQ